uniref:Centrosomal protein of 104 kDa n=1 Tax=Tetraodon nigroviridis TaxID=99883 RepID=H3D016_TETNG
MPRKIGFVVVSSSSHEENFSAGELMLHAPTVSGWRSSRLCSYPQHITLRLVERSRVRKLQLLAHQYMVPTQVEFHIGDPPPPGSSPGLPGQLRRLGCVSLSNNENTGFKARELKSGHVDAIGSYLRITFHRNHINRYNKYNQVALIAFNVLGDSVDDREFTTVPSREQLIELCLSSTQLEATSDTTFMGSDESISPLDDLAFDMYQDPEVAHIIRVLDQKKQEVVRQEKHEEAKNLKQAIADLQKVGERLARYDVEKQCAIEKRDYELAKMKKELMENYRRSVYQQLEVYNLLDTAMIMTALKSSLAQDALSLQSSPSGCAVSPRAPLSTETLRLENEACSPPQGQFSDAGSVTSHFSSLSVSPYSPSALSHSGVAEVPHDERPLPTLWSPAEQGSPLSDTQGSPNSLDVSGEPEPLSETAQRQAGLAVEVFGESLVAGAYSKTWVYRESAILNVYKKLLDLSPNTSKEDLRNTIRAAVFLVNRALLDKVSPVFLASLKLLWLLLSQLLPGLGRAEMNRCLEQTWPSLLARVGGPAAHLRAAVTAFILEIAVLKDVRALHIIPGELVKPFKASVSPRLAQRRVEMVEKLLADLGTENSGFTLENVMTFCRAAMEHSAAVVREVAVRIILSVYRQHGAAVVSYLPPKDAAARKNFLYKALFNEFAKIDGKPAATQVVKRRRKREETDKATGSEGNERKTLPKEATKPEKHPQKALDKYSKSVCLRLQGSKKNTTPSIFFEYNSYRSKLCIFCGETDESFTEEGLDLHYWTHCPMLRHCDECKQVVEIASLTEHLLGECGSRSKFRQCLRCSEAVLAEDLPRHAPGPACNPPTSGRASSHCPLCHNNFMPGEEAWKAHLMGRAGCKQNSRRTAASQRTQPAQGE